MSIRASTGARGTRKDQQFHRTASFTPRISTGPDLLPHTGEKTVEDGDPGRVRSSRALPVRGSIPTAPFRITMRRSDRSARSGSCVTKQDCLVVVLRDAITFSLKIPPLSTSSRRIIGALLTAMASAIKSERVWPPESAVMRIPRGNLFPGKLVCEPDRAFGTGRIRDPAGFHVHLQELADLQVSRHLVFWVMRAIEFFSGPRTISSGGTSPFTRMVRPVTVWFRAKTSMSLINAVFPERSGRRSISHPRRGS